MAWDKIYGFPGAFSDFYSIEETLDGGYIIAGRTTEFNGFGDAWIVKINYNGTVAWGKAFGGFESSFGISVKETLDGGYILSGRTQSYGPGDFDAWLIKLNPEGTLAWDKRYGGTGNDNINAVLQTPDGGYVVAGAAELSTNGGDVLIMKLDPNGDLSACIGINVTANNIVGDGITAIPDVTPAVLQRQTPSPVIGSPGSTTDSPIITESQICSGICSYSLVTLPPPTFPSSGGDSAVTIDPSDNTCYWTATAPSWISITSGASGTGYGKVSFTVTPNNCPDRSGSITIQGLNFDINQAGNRTSSLGSYSNTVPASGGVYSVKVFDSCPELPWLHSNNGYSWISITDPLPDGYGNSLLTYNVAANAGAARSGSMTIAGHTFDVQQNAATSLNAPNGLTIKTMPPPAVMEWRSDVDGNGRDDAEEVEAGDKPPGWVNYRVYYGTTTSFGSSLDVGDARSFQLSEINPTPDTDYYLAVTAYLASEPWHESPQTSPPIVYNLPSADYDSDGIPDAEDNCPQVANGPAQSLVPGVGNQLDTDWDGRGDACDPCPLDPDNDQDGDGLCGNVDNCPAIANPDQADSNGNGIGNACDGDVTPSSAEATTQQGSTQDSDFDGFPDISDNCPSVANNQLDSDGDGIGDICDRYPNDSQNDRDGDGVGGDVDNCLYIYNPRVAQWTDKNGNVHTDSQPDFDLDGKGDACDDDLDGDGIPDKQCAVASQEPCLQYASKPPSADGDNCPKIYNPDQNIAACQAQDVQFTFLGSASYDDWLPTDGSSFMVQVSVPSGSLTKLTVARVTSYPGKFTNDAGNTPGADYGCGSAATLCAEGMQISSGTTMIYSLDYGGSITLRAEASTPGGTVFREFTIPKDSDGDGLPDAWEGLYGDLNPDEDRDATFGNQFPGDKLTARQEYRGFLFGKLDPVAPTEANGYKTTAHVPKEIAEFFRGNPLKKELFIKYTGYSISTNPFAIGSALAEAGINVYALPNTVSIGTANIRVMNITHNSTSNYGTENGHINKVANTVRYWTWDTKGVSAIGSSTGYGSPITYQKALDYYFSDKTYYDKTPGTSGKLDPVSYVEDRNDNGSYDSGETSLVNNTTLDGDRYSKSTSTFSYNLSPFDIDKDGKVELPMASDSNSINAAFEYGKKQVLKHTITHEIGHALGVPETHTQEADCVMFRWSNNWSRDGKFGDAAKGFLRVINLGIQ